MAAPMTVRLKADTTYDLEKRRYVVSGFSRTWDAFIMEEALLRACV
jgi:hypothetical protein